MKRNVGWKSAMAVMAALALGALSACGGGDESDPDTIAEADGVETVAAERAQPLSVTPSTNTGGTTTGTINSAHDYFFASETPTATGEVTLVVTTTGKTIGSVQFQILPGTADRPPLALTNPSCATGTKTATKWTCKTRVKLSGPATMWRPYTVSVSYNATATGGGVTDTVAGSTGLAMMPPDTYVSNGISIFNTTTPKTRWGIKSNEGMSQDRVHSLHLPNGKAYQFYGDTSWNDAFSFTHSTGNTLVNGWLKPGSGTTMREFDFRRGNPLVLADNGYTVKPGTTINLKGKINEPALTLVYWYDLSPAPTTTSLAPASQVGTYLGRMNMMSPATVDIRVNEYFGYTVALDGSSYKISGITSATSIPLNGNGTLNYTPGQVRCTVTGTLAAGTVEYATVNLAFSGASCTLAGQTLSSVVVFNYGAQKYTMAGVNAAQTYAGMSFSSKVN